MLSEIMEGCVSSATMRSFTASLPLPSSTASLLVLHHPYAGNRTDVLKVGSTGYGFLQSTGGAGALCGTLIVAYFARSKNKGMQAIIGATTFGLLIIVFSTSTLYPLSLAIMLFMGMAGQFYQTSINTTLQLELPDEYRGRVMGIYGLTWSLMPLGGTISGTIAEFMGAQLPSALAASWWRPWRSPLPPSCLEYATSPSAPNAPWLPRPHLVLSSPASPAAWGRPRLPRGSLARCKPGAYRCSPTSAGRTTLTPAT